MDGGVGVWSLMGWRWLRVCGEDADMLAVVGYWRCSWLLMVCAASYLS